MPDVPGICCFVVAYTSKLSDLFETKVEVLSLPSLLTVISERYFQTEQNKAACQTSLQLSKLPWGLSQKPLRLIAMNHFNSQRSHCGDRAVIA